MSLTKITNKVIEPGTITANSLAAGISLGGGGVNFASVASHIVPAANVTYDLGSEAYKFRDLYLSGNSIKLGSATINSTGTSVQINDIIAERTYGSNNNGDPIIIIKNAAAANGLTINPNESGNNFHFLPNGNLQLPAGGGIVTDAAYGSNNNGDPIIIIKNAAAANGLTINPNESGKNFNFLASGNLQLPVGGGIVNSAGDSVLGSKASAANLALNTSLTLDNLAIQIRSQSSGVWIFATTVSGTATFAYAITYQIGSSTTDASGGTGTVSATTTPAVIGNNGYYFNAPGSLATVILTDITNSKMYRITWQTTTNSSPYGNYVSIERLI